MTFKNDASIILKAAELHGHLAKDLAEKVTDKDFTSHVAFQPLPQLIVDKSQATNEGGNILGLEQNPGDAILMQVGVSVRTQELADWVDPKVAAPLEGVQELRQHHRGRPAPLDPPQLCASQPEGAAELRA